MGSFQCTHLNLKTAVQWLFLSIPPLRDWCWCHSCCHFDPRGRAVLWWLCAAPEVHETSRDRSWASGRGCSGCPCGIASSQTPAVEWNVSMSALGTCEISKADKESASNCQPSSQALSLCDCSGWSPGGRRSAVRTDWTRAGLSLIWPTGCEVLWKSSLKSYPNYQTTRKKKITGRFSLIAHRWGAGWSLCVCRMDAPAPTWCRLLRRFGHWGLHPPSEREWGSPGLQVHVDNQFSSCTGSFWTFGLFLLFCLLSNIQTSKKYI